MSNKFILILIFILLAGICGLFIYGRYLEPDAITIREIHVSPEVVIPALKGKKIIHLSDLHMEMFGKDQTHLLNLIDQIQPDLIFLTGDYIQWRGSNKGALEFLSRLKARYGVFAVMGDYDYSDSRNSCLFCHERGSGELTKQHNVMMLRNDVITIKIDGRTISIAGIDNVDENVDLLDNIKEVGDPSSFLLLLSHSPLVFDKLPRTKQVFMFSGDTHGGQVLLPKWVYRVFGYQKNVKYNYGLFNIQNNYMYVSRGIGTSHFKFRLFCPPELAVFYF